MNPFRCPSARLAAAPGPAAALALLLALAPPARAGDFWTWEHFDSLMTVARDPARAAEITAVARGRIAAAADSADAFMGHSLLYRVAIARRDPPEGIAAAAESLLLACGADDGLRAGRARLMAQELGAEARTRPLALRFAREGFAAARAWGLDPGLTGACQAAVGRAHLESGAPDSAAAWLEAALGAVPDSAATLALLSRALAERGDDARALDAGVRSLAVYQASDTSAAPRVRELWRKRHGSLRGLEPALAGARARSRRRVLVETSRTDLPAPQSVLLTAEGDSVRLADHLGHVVVIEFWGTWSGASERALPRIEALWRRYRGRGVVFFGVDIERGRDRAAWLSGLRESVKAHGLTFPAIPDYDGLATLSYLVDSCPTTVLVDRAGRIRFKHSLSGSEDGEAILAEQIESLLQ